MATDKDGTGTALKSLRSESPIVVKDASGKIIATSKLGKGSMQDLGATGACVFPFEIADVPASDFYTIEIEEFKSAAFKRSVLQSKNWKLQAQISASSQTIADATNLAPATEEEKRQRKAIADLALATEKLKR